MSYLYVVEHGATVGISGGYFVVKYRNGMERKIPQDLLEAVSIFGKVSLTTQCIEECLKRGIVVNYFSTRGSYFGRLSSTRHMNIFRQKKQLRLSEDVQYCMTISKSIIRAKIHNQKVVLRRYIKNNTESLNTCIKNMNIAENKIENCKNYHEIMGFEGFASKNYFQGLSEIIEHGFKFNGRNRMPPRDPFNSMLSLGYTILMYEIYGCIENRGLHPYAGFLHQDKERHPTLASDLMEEWRAVIVDSVVLSLIQGNEVQSDMFIKDDETGGIFLNNDAMRIFIKKMEKKLITEMNYLSCTSYRTSFRRGLWLQTGEMLKAIEQEDPSLYEPIRIR